MSKSKKKSKKYDDDHYHKKSHSKHSKKRHNSESDSSKKKHKKKRIKIIDNDLSPEINEHQHRSTNDNYDATGFKRTEKRDDIVIFGYTNDNNPFMDQNLSENLVWKKNKNQQSRSNEEKAAELESVQRRQREHDKMKYERAMEQEMMQRAKEAESYLGRKPDSSFDIEQARNRSKIRIADGRAKPIDLLIEYINEEENLEASNAEVINHEPSEFITGLCQGDLEDLLVDIDEYSKNIEPGKKTQYWDDVLTITQDELIKFHIDELRMEEISEGCKREIQKELIESSIEDAEKLLEDAKNVLDKQSNSSHVIPGFYEYFLKVGKVLIARRRLQDRHLQNLRSNLDKLRFSQGFLPKEPMFPSCSVKTEESVITNVPENTKTNTREEYEQCYSPKLWNETEIGDEIIDNVIYNSEDDSQKLDYLRKQFLQSGANLGVEGEEILIHKMNTGTHQTTSTTNTTQEIEVEDVPQIDLAPQSFLWSDKYRPRRPKFSNRVNTGFDWNKYNQTHYDMDNPPPKVVQGYKFNILYPDLIDKSRTPTYELTPCPEDDQYAHLIFKAGPPYEDIAFKVVNREWETSERHGFKCQFYNDTLQLYFHFKRYRYRK